MAESDTSTSVYRYYDRAGVLIYVGITNAATNRNQQHNKDKAWWPFVSKQEVDHYDTRRLALDHERTLIQRFHPPFNTQHNADAVEMRQVYELFQQSGVANRSALEVWKSSRRSLPLDVLSNDSTTGECYLRSRLEHYPLVQYLNRDLTIPVVLGPIHSGSVTVCDLVGPFLSFKVKDLQRGWLIDAASLGIRMTDPKRLQFKMFGILFRARRDKGETP